MGFFDFLFGTDTPKTMTGNDVKPENQGWWSQPTDSSQGPAPDPHEFDGYWGF